jgi:hypothetical protein
VQQLEQVPHQDLVERCTFIGENEFLPSIDSAELGQLITDLTSPGTQPVLCLDTNPHDVDSVVSKVAQHLGRKKFFVLQWDADRASSEFEAYWPSCFLDQRMMPRRPVAARQYRISMLSGWLRPHRLKAFVAVQNLIHSNDVVVINRIGADVVSLPSNLAALVSQLPWSNRNIDFDQDQNGPAAHDHGLKHAAYRACVNVTNETLGPKAGVLVSEKTWKALRAGCMLFHYGCVGIDRYLHKLGFSSWHTQSLDWHQQLQDLGTLFARQDLSDEWHQHYHKLQQDIDFFYSDHLLEIMTNDAVYRLQSWLDAK